MEVPMPPSYSSSSTGAWLWWSLQMVVSVRLVVIPSVDKALCNLVTFAFVALHLFSAGRRHLLAAAELLHLIERL